MVVLAVLLGGPKPYLASASFLLGTALSYFAAGILIAVGLEGVIKTVTASFMKWLTNPGTLDYVLGIGIGIALVVLGYRWANARRRRAGRKEVSSGMNPTQAFVLGGGATLAGLWGALPYFAAIDQILKADISTAAAVLALAYYNIVFISLLTSLVLVRAVAGARAKGVFDAVNRLVEVWGKRVLIVLMMALGFVLIADGVGWLLGHPVIPVD